MAIQVDNHTITKTAFKIERTYLFAQLNTGIQIRNMLSLKWIKLLSIIILYVLLFILFCYFYIIDQMNDFIKGRTTVASRIEKVESVEPPTVTICLNPPYKSSKLTSFGLDNFGPLYDEFDNDYNNQPILLNSS